MPFLPRRRRPAGVRHSPFRRPRLALLEHLEPRMLLASLPTPTGRLGLDGAMVYRTSTSDNFAAANETDDFTLDLDAGQTVAILLQPQDSSLQGRLELLDPSAVSIGSVDANSAGDNILLQSVSAPTSGTYRIDVSNLAGTGDYAMSVTLNAVVEDEPLVGSDNDTLASAQDLEPSAVSIDGNADRLAVVGEIERGRRISGHAYSVEACSDQIYEIDLAHAS